MTKATKYWGPDRLGPRRSCRHYTYHYRKFVGINNLLKLKIEGMKKLINDSLQINLIN